MSWFPGETVIPMPPLSIVAAVGLGEAFLEELFPAALQAPTPIPWPQWVDYELPKVGIHVQPVRDEMLPNEYAVTDPAGDADDDVNILVRQSTWDALFRGGRQANHARATIAHELGHAIAHVPTIRRRRRLNLNTLLARVDRSAIPPYKCPEWQAWAIGATILAPVSTIRSLRSQGPVTPALVASTFHVSTSLAESHLKRLKML